MMQDASHWIVNLKLQSHPEGGFYREIYRSEEVIDGMTLTDKRKGTRNLATSIYFLLRSGEKSLFHRLRSDEIWYYQLGSPMNIYCIDMQGNFRLIVLGPEPGLQQLMQAVIPAGTIFASTVRENNSFSLAGCMVSPGFSFEDFEILSREYLLQKYPSEKDMIISLTKESKGSTLYY